MKAYVVYGPPCGGKSTYINDHIGDNDMKREYDAMLCALTPLESYSVEDHPGRKIVSQQLKNVIDGIIYHGGIDALWMQCSWYGDYYKDLLKDFDEIEEAPIIPTREECLEHLEKDDRRKDKAAWEEKINKWFEEHGKSEGGENRAMQKFWNWKTENEQRVLTMDGVIASESWWGDEVTPEMFRQELNAGKGDITVWINSPGGDCIAAAQIYNMLIDYKGNVTVKIDGIAASAASVIAMAGTEVQMSPVAMMMIHNPATIAFGDHEEMQKAIDMLAEVKESIINAYELKTGMSRAKIARLMDEETWMNAKKAVELGFADEIIKREDETEDIVPVSMSYSRAAVYNSLMSKIAEKCKIEAPKPQGRSADELRERLNTIKRFI